jgi:hypothetical protein
MSTTTDKAARCAALAREYEDNALEHAGAGRFESMAYWLGKCDQMRRHAKHYGAERVTHLERVAEACERLTDILAQLLDDGDPSTDQVLELASAQSGAVSALNALPGRIRSAHTRPA